MSWVTILIIVAVVAAILVARKSALISARDACRYLEEGAMIVDVRTSEEFKQDHVPDAINLPLPGLPDSVFARVPDKKQVLLLHCLGGGRSAIGQRLLRANGYTRAYNLGSYGRAKRIASASRRDSRPANPHSPPSP